MAWIGWLRDNLEWMRFQPQETWIGALDLTVTALLLRQAKQGRRKDRYQDGVTICVLWDGWGEPTGPCSFDINHPLDDLGHAPDPCD